MEDGTEDGTEHTVEDTEDTEDTVDTVDGVEIEVGVTDGGELDL